MLAAAAAIGGCASSGNTVPSHQPTSDERDVPVYRAQQVDVGSPVHALPSAVVYRTNGDYNDHVAVNIDRSTGRLMSYPAVTDVTAASSPVPLADGWLLDRRGGINTQTTAFLKYTYSQYAALQATPSPTQIVAAILPDARVTVAEKLTGMTPAEALADTAAVNARVRGLSRTIYVE